MRGRINSASLVTKVMVLSLIPIVVLGVTLARTMQHRIQARSLADARQSALLLAHLAQPHLSRMDLQRGISANDLHALDGALSSGPVRQDVSRLKVWNTHDTVVYSDDHRLTGRRFPVTDDLEHALRGQVFSQVSNPNKAENVDERRLGQVLEVYTPMRLAGTPSSAPPDGAFEIYVPYRRVAAGIASDSRMIFYMLAIGLSFLWAILYRIVSRASRALRNQASENRHQALHDALTGLPNRTHFQWRLQAAIDSPPDGGLALVLLDIDHFKEINDTLGHQIGDRLLKEIGPRLASTLAPDTLVARLGGDEFAVLLERAGTPERARTLAEDVVGALERPLIHDGLSLRLDASAGVSLHPGAQDDAVSMIRRAEVAMYQAKSSRTGVELYDSQRDPHSTDRLALLGELGRAIDEGQLVVHYQPQVRLADSELLAVEALVRWQHPERGLVGPDRFIPLAEQTGLIGRLTSYVLERALADAAAFSEAGLDVGVSVNLSTRSLLDPELPHQISDVMARNPATRGRLELEITESDVMSDPERAGAVLRLLGEMGIALAIDDFGTGYSSLAQLKRLHVDTLKIDKSFVFGMVEDPDDAAIVRSIVELARSLGLKAIAEGVETTAAWEQLEGMGCAVAQGFLISRAIPADEVVPWAQRWRAGDRAPVAVG